MHYYPQNKEEPGVNMFDQHGRNMNSKQPAAKQKISQPSDTLRKVVHKVTFGDSDAAVFCTRFSGDDKYLAVGYGDGVTRIYNIDTGKLAFTLMGSGGLEEMPVAAVAWRPVTQTMKTNNILVTAQADGTLKHWHATSGKCLHQVQEDPENHLYTMDFTQDGTLLAVAGKDKHIWVYDETTKSLAFKMKERGQLPGHSNRIFCVKFNQKDQNMLASAGWDNTVQINDLRYRGTMHSIWGPHVCGDAIAFRSDGYTMVTGSYRQENAIEVWDLRMFKRTQVVNWDGSGSSILVAQNDDSELGEMSESNQAATESEAELTEQQTENGEQEERKEPPRDSQSETTYAATSQRPKFTGKRGKRVYAPQLYTCNFNKTEDLLFCGGAGKNEMRVFDWNTGNIVALIGNLPKSVLCGAVSQGSKFCFGSADSRVRIFDIQSSQSTQSILGGGGSNRSYQM